MLEKIFQKDEKLFYVFYDLGKFLVFGVSFLLAYLIRFQEFNEINQYVNFTIFFIIIYLLIATYQRKEFFFELSIFSTIKNDIKFIFYSLILISLFLYLAKTSANYSRIWLILFIIFNLVGLIPYKILMNFLYKKIIKSNSFIKNVLIIGNYQDCKKILSEFKNKPNYHFRAMTLMNKNKNIDFLPIQEIPLDNKIDDNLKYNKISQIWIIFDFSFDREKLLKFFQHIPIDIRTIIPKSVNNDSYIDTFGQYAFYNTSMSPFYGIRYFFKIIMDLFFSLIFIIISIPIILISSLFILIEDGRPIFFKQKRYGWDGSFINIYKLRSLKNNNGIFKQVVANDDRLLKTGKIIRRLSIDELPQLFNILKGDMSLVGPRPHPVELDDQYAKKIRGFLQRLRCKPGLTGLAQVNGFRGPTNDEELMKKRFEYDLEYIKNWSPFLDMKIIIKTLFIFLFQKVD